MDCLEKLQQIGIKKINQETRISVGVLENILEKRFDKIQRVWVVGFLPILERQYGVDLSWWLEEYDAYYLAHQDEKQANVYRIKELELDTQQQKYDHFQSLFQRFSLKKALISIGVLLLLVLMVFVYKFFSDSESGSVGYSVVEEHGMDADGNKSDIYSQLGVNANEKEPEPLPPLPMPKDGEVMITPKGDLWFQVLNPKTQDKQDKTIKDTLIMPIPEEGTLIIFGHKGFSLTYKDGSKEYDGGGPIRFIVENGRLRYIKYSDYVKKLGTTQQKRDFQGSADTTLEDATDNTSTSENTTDNTSTLENTTNNASTLENTTDNASDEVKNEEQENTKTEEDSSN